MGKLVYALSPILAVLGHWMHLSHAPHAHSAVPMALCSGAYLLMCGLSGMAGHRAAMLLEAAKALIYAALAVAGGGSPILVSGLIALDGGCSLGLGLVEGRSRDLPDRACALLYLAVGLLCLTCTKLPFSGTPAVELACYVLMIVCRLWAWLAGERHSTPVIERESDPDHP